MSLHLEFEPHSWYMGFAIKRDSQRTADGTISIWSAYTDDGNTYRIIEREANTLERIKDKIRKYHMTQHNGYAERMAKRRLEYLRGELREGTMSYGEQAELQGLKDYIQSGDVELQEAAGVPESESW
jgi:hypothetical protein